jgi:hypothetical protein
MKKISTETPIMKARCKTCPFNSPDSKLANKVQLRVMTQASQLCHSTRVANKPETHLCRGARDYQLEIFYRLGVIAEPTDGSWTNKARQLGINSAGDG